MGRHRVLCGDARTTTLFAALDVKAGTIVGKCMPHHRAQEFRRFLDEIEWSFYRSKHELVFVFKIETSPHINAFGLGDTGRYRTNVWDYPGVNSFGGRRMDELAMHPTVKPVALVADAIRDCSK